MNTPSLELGFLYMNGLVEGTFDFWEGKEVRYEFCMDIVVIYDGK